MKRIAALALASFVALAPAGAEQADGPDDLRDPGDMREGIDLLGEGMRLFFKGLAGEIDPLMRDMAEGMEPAMIRLMELIDDIDAYQLPEKLPNGDIIIRRKLPDADSAPVGPEDEIEI